MGKVYSHLSEEERQVIQIEVGNGTSVRKMARLPGRSPFSISREIRRNMWFPSNESESYRPYRPKRLKTGPWTGRYHIADSYGSRRRGGDENRNGIIRRCLPKRTIIEPGMARGLREIVDETDDRPMRVLGYRTPAEAFADELLESAENKDAALTNRQRVYLNETIFRIWKHEV